MTRPCCAGVSCARTETRVLTLTMFDDDELVYAALRSGASGFLLKDTPPADLLSAISVIAQGDALLDPAVTRRLIADFVRRPEVAPPPPVLDGLTQREQEVLTLIARGKSNMEISVELSVSLPTVKTHVSRLLTKLDAPRPDPAGSCIQRSAARTALWCGDCPPPPLSRPA